jgi:CubicO group peptidase (beta-lactamase class C family)
MILKSKFAVACASAFLSAQLLTAQTASARKAPPPDVQRHIDKIASCLPNAVVVKDDPHSCSTLAERMAQFNVPGVSIAVIHNGAIEWAQGFGVAARGGASVTVDTLFQAGSISKPVAALAALHQVQNKTLTLDADINTELINWKVPDSPAANGKPVTLRELLTHTAGFTVHGFPGYAAGMHVPTVIQVLNGEKPANTPPIRLESEPGSKWNYSGGGYVVMEQTLLDITKQSFPKLMHDTVLGPIGMTHSTYDQPLPSNMDSAAAVPYKADGTLILGGAHTYPEMTAAGLWTTPSDLARYCIEVERSLEGKANHVLSEDMTKQMLTPGKGEWGLGVQIGGAAADPYFTHGGVNEGFEALFVAYEHHGDGAVVMTNAQGGSRLADQIMKSIGTEYGWPDFHAVVHTEIKLPHETLARYVGTYQLASGVYMMITLKDDQLISRLTGQGDVPLFAETETKFFPKVVDANLDFVKDANGKVTSLVLHQGGRDNPMSRLDDAEAKRISDETAAKDAAAAKRFKDQQPDPASEAAIRRNIADILAGQPKYDQMSDGLAQATRQQLPGLKTLFAGFGAIKSVTFTSVARNGADTYKVEFEHGSTEWHIIMAPDGKIDSLNFRVL